ncbi:MAG TPA: SPOR domain-containing protein [Caulobacteraceae bacterium]|jgi:outer membrane biosynthesis protein TonB
MSDHDRGAYTPHHDAPLSFDARRARGRRAFPTTLVVSLLILAGLGGAIFMFYRSGVRGAGEAPVPVGTPVGEIKSPPPAQAQQPQDAGQGLQIYKSEAGASAASSVGGTTTFAPPPEQPQARPTPPVAVQPLPPPTAQAPAQAPVAAAPAPKPATPQEVAVAPIKRVPAEPAPAPKASAPKVVAPKTAAPAASTAHKDEVGALLDKADAKPAPAAKAQAKPESTAGHGAAIVQFGAFSSAALASSEWAKLAKAYPSQMSGKGRLVETVERNGKTLFRGAVSGFAVRTDAVAFCAKLKADGKSCIVR